ncbi:MAG: ATP-binding protein [Nitrosopumilus sp.]|nr:ATP-binding protein [Nitrosopumilus sp.]
MNISNPRKTITRRIKPKNISRKIIYISDKMLDLKNSREIQSYFKNRKATRDKPIYIVELTNETSEYIGETEKNLNKIFERAKKMNWVLFFDEADALFGKRIKVKDSHEKNANIETNFLVKKFQKYKGIMFMTPNLKKPISEQDMTKIDYIICMPIKK